MNTEWQCIVAEDGMREWRARLLQPRGGRKYVYVREFEDGTAHAEVANGYVRPCASVEEAKRYLEGEGI